MRLRLTHRELAVLVDSRARYCVSCARLTPHDSIDCDRCEQRAILVKTAVARGHVKLEGNATGTLEEAPELARWRAEKRVETTPSKTSAKAPFPHARRCPNCEQTTNQAEHCAGVATIRIDGKEPYRKKRRPKLHEVRTPRDPRELELEAECDRERAAEEAEHERLECLDVEALEAEARRSKARVRRPRQQTLQPPPVSGPVPPARGRAREPEPEGEVARWLRRQAEQEGLPAPAPAPKAKRGRKAPDPGPEPETEATRWLRRYRERTAPKLLEQLAEQRAALAAKRSRRRAQRESLAALRAARGAERQG